jgi:hypothetical protein
VFAVRMLIGVVFGSLGSMMIGVQRMSMGRVGMMRRLVVVAVLLMLGGGAVVLGRVFMVLRGFVMMIDVVFGHGILS